MLFANPFIERATLNSQLTRCFRNREISHSKNTHPVYFVKYKIEPGRTTSSRLR